MDIGMPELVIALVVACSLLATLLLVAYPACRICRRLGYPAAVGVLAVVPLLNLGLLWFVAMSAWPVDTVLVARSQAGRPTTCSPRGCRPECPTFRVPALCGVRTGGR